MDDQTVRLEDTVFTDDEVLNFTQLQRRNLLNAITANGKNFPTDPKEAKVLLTALSDMDRTAIGKKRIKSDEDIAQMTAQSVDAIAQRVHKAMTGTFTDSPTESRPAPSLNDDTLPPLVMVEGETAIGVQVETHEQFSERYEKVHGKPKRRDD